MDSSDSSYYSRQQLDELFLQMIAFFSGDPKRIQHFMKVHSFARIIGTKEGLDETSLFILEAAAYTHDFAAVFLTVATDFLLLVAVTLTDFQDFGVVTVTVL